MDKKNLELAELETPPPKGEVENMLSPGLGRPVDSPDGLYELKTTFGDSDHYINTDLEWILTEKKTGKTVTTFYGDAVDTSDIQDVAFTPDGKEAVAMDGDGQIVERLDLQRAAREWKKGPEKWHGPKCMLYSDGTMEYVEASKQRIARLKKRKPSFWKPRTSRDGRFELVPFKDGGSAAPRWKLNEIRTGATVRVFNAFVKTNYVRLVNRRIETVAFSRDGTQVVAKDGQGKIMERAWLVSDQEIDLAEAVIKGRVEVIKKLLKKGADINGRSLAGKTMLMEVIGRPKPRVVKLLLEKGADVNARAADGRTALMEAAYYNKDKMIQSLLKKGADAEARDDEGNTALIIAAGRGRLEAVKRLVKAGADAARTNKAGLTARGAAMRDAREAVMDFLAESTHRKDAKDAKSD